MTWSCSTWAPRSMVAGIAGDLGTGLDLAVDLDRLGGGRPRARRAGARQHGRAFGRRRGVVAPVLVCPACSTKHPLGEVADRTVFPCTGCGRQLKVPAAAAAKETVPPSRPAGPRDVAAAPPTRTRVRDAWCCRSRRPRRPPSSPRRRRLRRSTATRRAIPSHRVGLASCCGSSRFRSCSSSCSRSRVGSACSPPPRSRTWRSPRGGVGSGRSCACSPSSCAPRRCSCRAASSASPSSGSGGGRSRRRETESNGRGPCPLPATPASDSVDVDAGVARDRRQA